MNESWSFWRELAPDIPTRHYNDMADAVLAHNGYTGSLTDKYHTWKINNKPTLTATNV